MATYETPAIMKMRHDTSHHKRVSKFKNIMDSLSDFIPVTTNTQRISRISTNSPRVETYAKGAKNGGKARVCTFGAKIETKASSIDN